VPCSESITQLLIQQVYKHLVELLPAFRAHGPERTCHRQCDDLGNELRTNVGPPVHARCGLVVVAIHEMNTTRSNMENYQ
jgi:hypothetical protein